MRKFLQSLSFLTLLLLLTCSFSVSAGTKTISTSTTSSWADKFSADGTGFVADFDGYKVRMLKNTSSTALVAPDASSMRIYAGAQLQIEAPEGVLMTSIKLTTASSSKETTVTPSTGWSPTSISVQSGADKTFTVSSTGLGITTLTTTAQLRIKTIEITYAEPADYVAPFEDAVYSMIVGETKALEFGDSHPVITYSYDPTGIVNISTDGIISAIKKGETIVSAKWAASKDFKAGEADFIVNVKNKTYSPKFEETYTIPLNDKDESLPLGEDHPALTFEYTEEGIVSIDPVTGDITPLAVGETMVECSWEEGNGFDAGSSDIFTITIEDSKLHEFEPDFAGKTFTYSIDQEPTLTLGARQHPALTFEYGTEGIVSIATEMDNAVGTVKILKAGTTTVTCKWDADDDFTAGQATFEVTVNKLTYAPDFADLTLTVGATTKLEVPANPVVTFTSSNAAVATVDAEGNIKGLKAGFATITYSWEENDKYYGSTGTQSFKVTVSNAAETVTLVSQTEYGVGVATSGSKVVNDVTTTIDPISFSWAKNSGTTNPTYYDNGKAVRIYKNNSLKVSAAEGCVITKVVFTYNSTNTGTIQVGNETVNNGTWVSATDAGVSSVTFNATATAHLQTVTVYYVHLPGYKRPVKLSWVDAEHPATPVEVFECEPSTTKGLPELTVSIAEAKGSVKITSSNPEVATVNEAGEVIINKSADGETTITASIADTDEDFKATSVSYILKVHVKEIVELKWFEDEHEVTEARYRIGSDDDKLPTLWLDDEEARTAVVLTSSDPTVAQIVTGEDGVMSVNPIAAGTVIITASIDPENHAYKHKAEVSYTLTVTVEKHIYTPTFEDVVLVEGASKTLTLDKKRPAIEFVSSDPSVATIDAEGNIKAVGAGKAVITYSWAEDDDYKASTGELSFNITVLDAAVSVTLVSQTEYSPNGTKLDNKTTTKDPISFKWAKGSGSTEPAYYDTGTAVRLYPNNSLTISASEGYGITKVVFTYDNTYTNGVTIKADGVAVSNGTWETKADTGVSSVEFAATGSGHARIQTVTVYYVYLPGNKRPASLEWVDEDGATVRSIDYYIPKGELNDALPVLNVNPAGAKRVVKIESSNENVATVDNGVVTIVTDADVIEDLGTTVIKASIAEDDDTYTAETVEYTLYVHAKELVEMYWRENGVKVTASGYNRHQEVSSTNRLPDLILSNEAAKTYVKLESSDTEVATINGLNIEVIGDGKTTITATMDSPTYKADVASFVLTVDSKSRVTLTWVDAEGNAITEPQSFNIKLDVVEKLPKIKVSDNAAEEYIVVTADEDNANLVVIDENNLVKPKYVGTVTITASIPESDEYFRATPVSYVLTISNNELPTSLTLADFPNTTTGYQAQTATEKGITFAGVIRKQSATATTIGLNTTNYPASSIVVAENENNLIIESIEIEFAEADNVGVNVYGMNKCFQAPALGVPTDLTDATKLNTSAVKTNQKVKVGKSAFAIIPAQKGALLINSIKINYFMHSLKDMTPHPDKLSVDLQGGKITVLHDFDGVAIHYLFTPEQPEQPARKSKVSLLALDRADFTNVADKDENGVHTINISGPGTLEYTGYHADADIQGLTNAIAVASDGTTTGIESVTDGAYDADAEYYTLQGIRVEHPAPGNLYIKRQGNTVTKVIM